jgi:hypothetical protein
MGVLYPSVTTFLQDKLLFLIVRTIMGNLGADDPALPEITVIFLYVVAYCFPVDVYPPGFGVDYPILWQCMMW